MFLECLGGTYAGTISCIFTEIDITATIESVGDDCYLFVESECLGWTEGDRKSILITKTANDKCLTFEGEWQADASGCGDSSCTEMNVHVRAIELLSNPFAATCDGCTTCACFPYELCLVYSENVDDGEGGNVDCIGYGIAEWSSIEQAWIGSVFPRSPDDPAQAFCTGTTINVRVEATYDENTKKCQLQAILTGGQSATSNKVVIGESSNGPGFNDGSDGGCPNDNWTVSFGFGGNEIALVVSSNYCGQCFPVNECCPNILPLQLTATITNDGCDNSCEGSFELNWDGSYWYGSGDIGCGTMTLRVFCTDPTGLTNPRWRMEYSTDCPGDPGGDGGGTGTPNTESCDPFELDFGIIDAGANCCSTGGISIVVTE